MEKGRYWHITTISVIFMSIFIIFIGDNNNNMGDINTIFVVENIDFVVENIYNDDATWRGGEYMAIEYKFDVLQRLREKGINATVLREYKLLSETVSQSLRHKRGVTFDTLNRLCILLECKPGDIIDFNMTAADKQFLSEYRVSRHSNEFLKQEEI